jgi:hypothetical protein
MVMKLSASPIVMRKLDAAVVGRAETATKLCVCSTDAANMSTVSQQGLLHDSCIVVMATVCIDLLNEAIRLSAPS